MFQLLLFFFTFLLLAWEVRISDCNWTLLSKQHNYQLLTKDGDNNMTILLCKQIANKMEDPVDKIKVLNLLSYLL